MIDIDPSVSCHHLKIDTKFSSNRQKRRTFNLESYKVLNEEICKLISNGSLEMPLT